MDFNFATAWAFCFMVLFFSGALACMLLGYGPPVKDTTHGFVFGGFCAAVIFIPMIWATFSR